VTQPPSPEQPENSDETTASGDGWKPRDWEPREWEPPASTTPASGTGDQTMPFTHQPYGAADPTPPQPADNPYGQPTAQPTPPPAVPYGPPSDQPPAPAYGQPTYQQPAYGQQYPPQPYAPAPYAPQPYGYAAPQQNEGLATAAMIVGIVSLVLACGYGIGLLGSPVALFMGRAAKKRIDRSNGTLGGRGMAQAGFILGIVGTVFLLLAIIAVVVIIIVAVNGGFDTDYSYTYDNS
jgi:hypothetical protein